MSASVLTENDGVPVQDPWTTKLHEEQARVHKALSANAAERRDLEHRRALITHELRQHREAGVEG